MDEDDEFRHGSSDRSIDSRCAIDILFIVTRPHARIFLE
ncbi:hypothetical protein C7S17_4138 [Burkholderia thailandensis]|nr:hypothetical protein [Burkholderia thailandensis]